MGAVNHKATPQPHHSAISIAAATKAKSGLSRMGPRPLRPIAAKIGALKNP
jgi:hypothetical protein